MIFVRLRRSTPVIVLIFLWSCLAEGFAQDIRFEHLDVGLGLSQSGVYSIIQDSRGFMWIGTSDGLYRYDGYEVKSFKKIISEPTSLSANWIQTLHEDHTGLMWVGTNLGGVYLFDPITERFTRLMHEPDDPSSLSDNRVSVIYEDRAGTVWVGTDGGLNRYERETGQFTRFVVDSLNSNSISSNYVTSLYQDHSGILWIGSEIGGLDYFDPKRNAFTHLLHDPERPSGLTDNSVRAILEDDADNLWVSEAYSGVVRLDRARRHLKAFQFVPGDTRSLSHNDVWDITQDRRGQIWFATRTNGITIFDPQTGLFTRVASDSEDPGSLSSSEVNTIYEDRSGLIWIGTGRGVNTYDPRGKPFKKLVVEHESSVAVRNDNDVFSILQDRSKSLWIGTSNGLFHRMEVDGGQLQFTHFHPDSNDAASLSNREVFAIHESRDGTLWIGTADGLNELAPVQQGSTAGYRVRFTHWLRTNSNLSDYPDNQVFAIVEDPDLADILWLATARGLIRFDCRSTAEPRYTVFNRDPGNPYGLQSSEVRTLLFDRKGLLWIGTRMGGLYRFDRSSSQFTWFAHDPDDPGSLSNNAVRSIYEDRRGTLWIGTDFGLNRMDRSLGRFETFTQRDGLPNDIIYGIMSDAAGHLWLSTQRGLSQFDSVKKVFRNFSTSDGLGQAAFNRGAYFKAASGELFFGSTEGAIRFHPDSIRSNEHVPPVVITSLRRYNVDESDNQLTFEQGVPWKSDIELSYRDIMLTFEFAALNFRNPRNNQYAYRLVGYHDQWIQLGNERSVTFTSLDPGTYTLQVKGSNDDGVWNEEGTALRFSITPPPWKMWWAYFLYSLAFVALLYVIRKFELSRVQLKNRLEQQHAVAEKLRELDQMKSRFFANVSHEFRTPLTLTLGPLDDLKSGLFGPLTEPVSQQVRLARRNAARVLDLINQILDVARLEAGRTRLRTRPIDLSVLVDVFSQPFRTSAERKSIALAVDLPPEPVEVYADPAMLEKVLTNLLSNALKFTPEGGTIRVKVSAEDGHARVCFRDNGPGIPAVDLPHIFDRFYQVGGAVQTLPGTGIGLALAKEIMDLHGGVLAVESEEGLGSTFTVLVPLGKSHLTPEQINETTEPWMPGATKPVSESIDDVPVPVHEDSVTDMTTVLVVEDHAEVRAYIRRHLETAREGSPTTYRVLEAADGEAGLALAKAYLPDIVLSDVMMPKLDGLGLCRALKADPETDFIPVILLTAKAAPEDRLEGLSEHADDYLTKPLDMAELKARIKNLITIRQRLRDRFSQEESVRMQDRSLLVAFSPREPDAVSAETVFLERVREVVEAYIGDDTFSVERLAAAVGMSRVHLHRQLGSIAGRTPSEIIRTMRLERAAQLLKVQAGTVSEVAYGVGYKSVSHFSTSFRRQYDVTPTEYATKNAEA